MESLETELARARDLEVDTLADAIESIGFECTRCGACCTAPETAAGTGSEDGDNDGENERGACHDPEVAEPHTATVFPDEVRDLQEATAGDWRDVARPMPYGLSDGPAGPEGETFEWALQTDGCGDCVFYEEAADGTGACGVHADRPLVCQTYPFSVALGGTSQPLGEAVDREGIVRAHECEGLGRSIDREDAVALARALKERAISELREAIDVRDAYEPVDPDPGEIVVHDSEGAKSPDGTPR